MRLTLLLLLCLLSACAHDVRADDLADLSVYDRTTGTVLRTYSHHGQLYVAGEPHHEYELRIASRHYGRILAVASVDGVNVISGQTASPGQSGYVIEPRGAVMIAGWRKSLQDVAAFYFTELPDSYAARTGRPDNVGVIGVALFREQPACCEEPRPDFFNSPSAKSGQPAPSSEAAQAAPGNLDRIGTGHGRIEGSAAQETAFRRRSSTPDQVISVWYNSYAALVAQGIIRDPGRFAQNTPNPFPAGFVPDPP